ncbi:hypothetical protein ACN24K_01645 [Streptomyces microflavus]
MTTRKPIIPSMIIPGERRCHRATGARRRTPVAHPGPGCGCTAAPPPTAPPAVVVPAPAPPPEQVHHHRVHVTLQPLPYYEPIEPTRRARLWAWITSIGRPWQIAAALGLAYAPIPGVGYSVATIWASCVTEARAEYGQGQAYALALTPLAIAVMRIVQGGGTLRRLLLLAISLTGLMGAIDLYDPVTWITGVHPS